MSKNIFSFFSKHAASADALKTLTPEMLSFLEQLPTAVILADQTGKIVLANPAALSFLGYDPKSLSEMTIQHLGISEQQFKALQSTTVASKYVLMLQGGNNKKIAANLGAKPFGQTGLVLISLEEMPQYKQQEGEKAFLTAILDGYPGPVFAQDVSGRCVFWNEPARKLFGHTIQQAQGQIVYQLFAQKFAASLHWMDEELCAGKTLKKPLYLPYPTSDGKTLQLSVEKVLLPGGDKPTQFIVTFFRDVTADCEQAQNLERSHKLLQAILENIPLGIYTRASDRKVTYINKQGLHILNETTSSLEEKHSYQEASESEGYVQREQQILREGKTYEYPEEVYVDSSGKERIVHMIKVPLMDAGPKPLVLTIVEDVTKRRQQEEEIRRVNGFLSAIVQNAPIALYARAENGKMLLYNKQCNALFGMMEEPQFDEKSGLPHETAEQVANYLSREHEILEKGETLDIPEEEYVTSEGKKKLLHLVKAPVQDSRCVITLVEDVTSRKEQERALVESKNFLQTVINQLPVSLSVKNYAGQYILWNKKSEELFGASAQEVIGKNAYRADLNKEQSEFVRETDLRVFESKKEQNIAQELISSAKEGIKIMHTVKTPVYHSDGTPDCLLIVSEDITAKTKMEKQIREASDKNILFIENAHEGVAMIEDGKIMDANRAFFSMLGFDDLTQIKGKMLSDLSTEDHRVFLKEKYEAVRAGTETDATPIDIHFIKKNGGKLEGKFSAILATYLGRRIVLGFVSDVTAENRILRNIKQERDDFRRAFENSSTASFILSTKGYISVMNEACRKLFGFTTEDKNFYCNVYIRPAISLAARRLMKQGLPANMTYTFDFDRAARKFPDRIKGKGQLKLAIEFAPIFKRNTKDGMVETQYLVSLQKISAETTPNEEPPSDTQLPKPPAVSAETGSAPKKTLHLPQSAKKSNPLPPLPPTLVKKRSVTENSVILPNSEPYALCDENFIITDCNEQLCSLCELQPDELKGQDIRLLFHPDEKPLIEQDFQLLKKDGTLSNREYTIHLGSSLETCKVRLMAVRQENGLFLFVLHSLAFHLQIMKILEERSAQLSALYAATDGAVLRVELERGNWGSLEQLNSWLSKKTGYTHEELAQKQFSDLFEEPSSEHPSVALTLAQAQQTLAKEGKASFVLPLRVKEGECLQAQVTLSSLEVSSSRSVLAVVRDLSAQQAIYGKLSKEAQELISLRQTLPGLYLRVNDKGKVLEVSSNLSYLDEIKAQELFLSKELTECWPQEAAAQALFTLKEALSMQVRSHFDFRWEYAGEIRYCEAEISPLKNGEEAVLWVKDISQRQIYDRQLHELYRLSQETGLSMTEQVKKILLLGKDIFEADLGVVLRFEPRKSKFESVVLYTSPNALKVERHMSFPVEECLQDVVEGATVLLPDLGGFSCTGCLHQERRLNALVAAPLIVDGKVEGALCFAARRARNRFAAGTEELLGLMARLLALRIELRQADKMLGDASRVFTRTLDDVQVPALKVDPDFLITYVNEPILRWLARRKEQLIGQDLFSELIRHEDISRRTLQDALRQAEGKSSCQVKLEVLLPTGLYQEIEWDVVVCKNAQGDLDGYAFVASGVGN